MWDYNKMKELRMFVPASVKSDLKNISDNLGTTVPGFLRTEIIKIVSATPDNLKQPKKED